MAAFTTALLWLSAIGCGLIAGLYFAFSTTIMRALGQLEPQAGMVAMVSIIGGITCAHWRSVSRSPPTQFASWDRRRSC